MKRRRSWPSRRRPRLRVFGGKRRLVANHQRGTRSRRRVARSRRVNRPAARSTTRWFHLPRRSGGLRISGAQRIPQFRGSRSRPRWRDEPLARPVGPLNELGGQRSPSESEDAPRQRYGLRLSVAAIVVVGLFSVLAIRLWSLQVIQGASKNAAAVALTEAQVQTPAPRGYIYTRDGTVLAGDTPETVVTLDLPDAERSAPDPPTVAMEQRLASLIPGLTLKMIQTQMKSVLYYGYQPIPIAGIPPELPVVSAQTAALLSQDGKEFPEVSVDPAYSTRIYPQGALAAQAIGYVSPINQVEATANPSYSVNDPEFGQSGLEGQYEKILAGKPGIQNVEVGPYDNVESSTVASPPVPGDNLITNIDAGLEQTVQADVAAEVQRLGVQWGSCVVLDPQNGAVLALASVPSYNNNDWISNPSSTFTQLKNAYGSPLLDYAVDGGVAQPPGSTFKIATATAALNDGLITPETSIDDPGYFTIGNETLHDSESSALGYINVVTALSASSDVFFYNLGNDFYADASKYGTEPIENMAKAYGLGNPDGTLQSPGIDLINVGGVQVDGPNLRKVLHSLAPRVYPGSYYAGDAVETAFGQGFTLETPLTLANAYATFANGGTRYAPEVGAEIVSSNDKLINKIAPKVLDQIHYGPGVHAAMAAGFAGAVQSGGTAAVPFAGFDFSAWNVSGKTGTATYASGQPTGWFVGFGGPKGEPAQYTAACDIYRGGYGAESAAIVVRQIFDYLVKHPAGQVQIP